MKQWQSLYQHQLDQFQKKQKELQVDYIHLDQLSIHYDLCSTILDSIFQIQDRIYLQIQDNNTSQFDNLDIIQQAINLFLNDQHQVENINRGDYILLKHHSQAHHLSIISDYLYHHFLNCVK